MKQHFFNINFFEVFMRSATLFCLAAFAILLGFTGCSRQEDNGKLRVAAGLPPIAGLTAAIGGDRVDVISVLPQGKTPHDFTPGTGTIRQTSGAKVFFTTGMPFENKISDFMQNRAEVCDVTTGIERIAFHDGGDHDHRHHDGCTKDDHDPHVWLAPANAIAIAENILQTLCKTDPQGAEYYRQNFEILRTKLQKLDQKISVQLAPYAGRTFFVYHPAFGYFAHAYKLNQRAIELNGREATTTQLVQIRREAEAAGVKTVFIQEQFNPGSAEALARNIGGKAVALDPLAQDLSGNLEKIADAIAAGFSEKKE